MIGVDLDLIPKENGPEMVQGFHDVQKFLLCYRILVLGPTELLREIAEWLSILRGHSAGVCMCTTKDLEKLGCTSIVS